MVASKPLNSSTLPHDILATVRNGFASVAAMIYLLFLVTMVILLYATAVVEENMPSFMYNSS